MQALYSSATLLSYHVLSKPRPQHVSSPLWKLELKKPKVLMVRTGQIELKILFSLPSQ
jgi:hypothetical protein